MILNLRFDLFSIDGVKAGGGSRPGRHLYRGGNFELKFFSYKYTLFLRNLFLVPASAPRLV